MKRFLSVLLSAVLVFSIFPMAFAEDEITVYLKGEKLEFPIQQPIIVNDRTLVPMRVIFEKMGVEVEWNNTEKIVTAHGGGVVVELQINNLQMRRNSEYIDLDTAPILLNDTTLVPLRAVSEAFDLAVEWDNEQRSVIITKKLDDACYENFPDVPVFNAVEGTVLKDEEDLYVITFERSEETSLKLIEYLDSLKELGFERNILGIFYPYTKGDTTVFVIHNKAKDKTTEVSVLTISKNSDMTFGEDEIAYYEECPDVPSFGECFGAEQVYAGFDDGHPHYIYELAFSKISFIEEYDKLLKQLGFMALKSGNTTTYIKGEERLVVLTTTLLASQYEVYIDSVTVLVEPDEETLPTEVSITETETLPTDAVGDAE
ncbi:MAG: copper amine oxidase N-terminal domain-containing protein [Clostridia bacterium]|nr:copper amine oxidase N-terminal domain-containing protein [Clostridia bacterium]